MFTGKGGVGKTTVSCSFARYWARQFPEEKILLISTDPASSLGDVMLFEVKAHALPLADLPNLSIQALDAQKLLLEFKAKYSHFLELLIERGSLAEGEDLYPVWDLDWPGLNELMGLLEIQRLLSEKHVDRVILDMAPTGHALNLFRLKDFLDVTLNSLEMFQQKHRAIVQSLTGSYTDDEVDKFLVDMKFQFAEGRRLMQDEKVTGCLVVAISEPMCLLETKRLLESLKTLDVPYAGLFINKVLTHSDMEIDRYAEQQNIISQYLKIAEHQPVFIAPQQNIEPLGGVALDDLMSQIKKINRVELAPAPPIQWPTKVLPGFGDFIAEGCQLIIVGGKGGVGKTTVAAAIGWACSQRYQEKKIRTISIDPAHSLGDAFGQILGHEPVLLTSNLSAQEIDADKVLEKFRSDYLWELADMMGGESSQADTTVNIAYLPDAWRQIMSQALPGIDEILSLITVMDLLDRNEQDLIILDTAPTGHLLRFLEMPSALEDWLSWIFKLWMKYQNVVGRLDFMSRLRHLRQQVVQAQKNLKDPHYTQFIGVIQNQPPIIAEHIRLTKSLKKMGLDQRYIVQNYYTPDVAIDGSLFPEQSIVCLPSLPRSVEPIARIKCAANLLFDVKDLSLSKK